MHTKGTGEIGPRAKWIEGIFLLAAAPFLLFPEQSIIGTTGALIVITAIWLWPVLFKRSPLLHSTPYNLIMLLFVLMLLVGILVTADPELTLPKATGIILGISIWRYIVIYVKSPAVFSWAVFCFILVGSAMTFLGFLNADWLLKSTSQVPFLQGLERISFSEAITIFGAENGIHPNQIAGLILLYLPLLLSLFFGSRYLHGHKLLLISLASLIFMATLTLLLTQSRSGWLGFVGGIFALLVLWAWFLPESRLRKSLWAVLLSLIALSTLFILRQGPIRLVDVWLNPPQETAIGSLATLNFRQEIWPWAVAAIRDFPYTGTGLGTFRVVARRFYPIQVVDTFDIAHAHNIFLQMGLDLGIPGLISYFALLIISIIIGIQIARRDITLRPVSIGILAGIFAFHVYGLTDALAIGSKPSILFWILIALLTSANQIINGRRAPETEFAVHLKTQEQELVNK